MDLEIKGIVTKGEMGWGGELGGWDLHTNK